MRSKQPTIGILATGVALFSLIAAGAAHASWPARADRAVALSPPLVDTGIQDACSDGAGGAFVAWGARFTPIAIEHIDAFGDPVYPTGTWVSDASTGNPMHLAPDQWGGAMAVLRSYPPTPGQYGLGLHRIGADGTRLWTASLWQGKAPAYFDWTRLSTDSSGATVVWNDSDNSGTVLRAQRCDGSGQKLWGSDGAVVASLPYAIHVGALARDGMGGWWVAFGADSTPRALRLQHLSASGAVAWPDSGLLIETDPVSVTPWQLSPDGSGGTYLSFFGSSGSHRVQRVRANGALVLGTHGIVPPGPAGASMEFPSLGNPANGHVMVAWNKSEAAYLWSTQVQLLDTLGTWLWPGSGVVVAVSHSSGTGTRIEMNADGGATMTVQPASPVFGALCGAQRFDADGVGLWPDPAPIVMGLGDYLQTFYSLDGWHSAPTGDGGVMYFRTYADSGLGMNKFAYRVRVQHLDGNGRLGDTSPRIVSLVDAPADAGGWLEVRWHASCLEGDATMATQGYDILRQQPNGSGGVEWAMVGAQSATGDSEYVALVPTLADSTSPGAPGTSVRIRAHDGANRTWLSPSRTAASFANGPPLAVGPGVPGAFALWNPEPSPATNRSSVRYSLPSAAQVSLELFDTSGRRLRTISHGMQAAGAHAISMETVDESGHALPTGLYFVRLEAPGRSVSRRLVVLR